MFQFRPRGTQVAYVEWPNNPTENGDDAVVGGWDEVKMGSTISYLKTLFKNLFVFLQRILDNYYVEENETIIARR